MELALLLFRVKNLDVNVPTKFMLIWNELGEKQKRSRIQETQLTILSYKALGFGIYWTFNTKSKYRF